MKKKILSILAVALCMVGTMQAQTIVDQATYRVKFDEQTTEPLPSELIKGKKAIANIEKPEAVNDEYLGWVRKFDSNKTPLLVNRPLTTFGTKARTFSFWMYLDSKTPNAKTGAMEPNNNSQVMFTSAPVTGQNSSLMIMVMGGRTIRINPTASPTNKIEFSGNGQSLFDSWHHISFVVNDGAKASEMKCYIDGMDYGTPNLIDVKGSPVSDFVCNTLRSFIIFGHSFSGKLSEFAFFDKALTVDEVNQVMKLTK